LRVDSSGTITIEWLATVTQIPKEVIIETVTQKLQLEIVDDTIIKKN
jgi:hypothetical protein